MAGVPLAAAAETETTTEAVRLPIEITRRRFRALDERLLAASPRLMQAATRWTFRLRPGSRLRSSLVSRNVRLSYEAQNRGDWRFVLAPYGDASELRNEPIADGEASRAVVQVSYHGRGGALQLLEDWLEPFDEVHFEPQELYDIGDGRLLVLSHLTARGKASAIEIREPLAQLIRFEEGMVALQQNWLGSWTDGLQAAGVTA